MFDRTLLMLACSSEEKTPGEWKKWIDELIIEQAHVTFMEGFEDSNDKVEDRIKQNILQGVTGDYTRWASAGTGEEEMNKVKLALKENHCLAPRAKGDACWSSRKLARHLGITLAAIARKDGAPIDEGGFVFLHWIKLQGKYSEVSYQKFEEMLKSPFGDRFTWKGDSEHESIKIRVLIDPASPLRYTYKVPLRAIELTAPIRILVDKSEWPGVMEEGLKAKENGYITFSFRELSEDYGRDCVILWIDGLAALQHGIEFFVVPGKEIISKGFSKGRNLPQEFF